MPHRSVFSAKALRPLVLAGVAAAALTACAGNAPSVGTTDYTGLSGTEAEASVSALSARYAHDPRDKTTIIRFAAALRAIGQTGQAVAVLQRALEPYPDDLDIKIAYAKALAADGRFEQGLNIVEQTIEPADPNWNALLVKGAILDQVGRHDQARQLYRQALVINPGRASIEANLGLSYAMTNDLTQAEAHLRRAVSMQGASSQILQNLALVVGLQGRFNEARRLYARTLPPKQVDANMAYVRALLTQQNRWDLIKNGK